MKKIGVLILLVASALYFYMGEDKTNKLNVIAQNRILAVAMDYDISAMGDIREHHDIDAVVTVSNAYMMDDEHYLAEGVFRLGAVCKNIVVKWKKDALFTPENRLIMKNEKC
ncbi:hypothetical protein [Aeromonas simiae]|uniref:Uncharacterized protein n=1 Tax=Aeromonas simiae TaxID=218936 RepID=A0A5J6WYX7_9GAMM|nr:hypothetical protein [Aeromonas simiae]MDO2948991.1 hypothetical protein [Aeromonas simiae]MDO2952478.1 hypothetical protein [Aeromonas simiae]MDO2956773.1 hypothetical protein [Aeromonas simiae]QFI56272.1 hypothetical protein FE240_17245 [Aeromonas simiae]